MKVHADHRVDLAIWEKSLLGRLKWSRKEISSLESGEAPHLRISAERLLFGENVMWYRYGFIDGVEMPDKVYPPTYKVRLPSNAFERWRLICRRAKSTQKSVTLSDADRVLLSHLEEILDLLLEVGSAGIDISNRAVHLFPEGSAPRPEISRLVRATNELHSLTEALGHIDTDLKVH